MQDFSYLNFYIDNPVLVPIFEKYRDFFEDRGFSFDQSEETGNCVLSYSDEVSTYINVPKTLRTAAKDFVKYNRFDFFEDQDEMCDDLLSAISSQAKKINGAYQRLEISFSYTDPDNESYDEDDDLPLHYQVLKYEDGQESYQEYDEEI